MTDKTARIIATCHIISLACLGLWVILLAAWAIENTPISFMVRSGVLGAIGVGSQSVAWWLGRG